MLFAKIDELMRQQQGQKDLGLDVMSVLPAVAINTLWYIIAGVKHELDDQKFVDLTKTVLRFFRLGDQGSPVNFYRALQHVPFINKVFQQQKQCGFELNNYVKVRAILVITNFTINNNKIVVNCRKRCMST